LPIDPHRYGLFHCWRAEQDGISERKRVARVCKVLIVEDDPAVQQVFDMVLADKGYELVLARDGASMRRALAVGDIDAVIIDVMLPGGETGLALANEAAGHGCGVILVTGHYDHYQRVAESGYRHLFKPFRLSALTGMVERVLREQDAQCQVKSRKHRE
jgi:DNA-binding NtrC family response regulator